MTYKQTLLPSVNKILGPNSQQLTILKSMVYSNPLTKISTK